MTWLVTGGAGYIGAHVVRAFHRAGIATVVLDDLSTGHAHFLPSGTPLVRGTILDTELVARTLRAHAVTGVMHVAGFKFAGVSVREPLLTYQQNVTGTASVLQAMQDVGVDRIVFSSSAAVYGTPSSAKVTEQTPTVPESPYGESKLIGEWLLADHGRAHGTQHTSLRYFNVVGSADPLVHDTSPHNLFPLVFAALLAGERPVVNGTDHPTTDGTCVRDYVHVGDLATSHVAAARALADGAALRPAYNLGSGVGVSVAQIMTVMAEVTGIRFDPRIGPRRPGDPARIVAEGRAATADLDWCMRHSLREMVASAWQAHTAAADSPGTRDEL